MGNNDYFKKFSKFVASSNAPKRNQRQEPKKPETKFIPKEQPKKVPKEEKYNPEKEFLATFRELIKGHRSWDIWSDFIVMFACSISNAVDKSNYDEREKIYLKTIKKYNKKEQQLFPKLCADTVMALDENPEQDFFGRMFMNLKLGNEHNGQFFTPYHVSQLMADITCGNALVEIEKKGVMTIHDSCCGAGAMLIAGINSVRKELRNSKFNFQNYLLVTAQDIDFVVALMCYIQISLLGVAGYVKVGNSLTEPMCVGDDTKKYWYTPIYFSEVWALRRIFNNLI